MLAKLARRLPFYYGWLVVAVVFVTMGVGVNARTAFSLLYPPILDEFGWERGVTAGVILVRLPAVSRLLSPLFGRMMDSHGPRTVTLLGIARHRRRPAAGGLVARALAFLCDARRAGGCRQRLPRLLLPGPVPAGLVRSAPRASR